MKESQVYLAPELVVSREIEKRKPSVHRRLMMVKSPPEVPCPWDELRLAYKKASGGAEVSFQDETW